MSIVIKIINKSHHPLPDYATPGASGVDLRANLEAPILLKTMERCLIPTSFYWLDLTWLFSRLAG